MTGRAAGRRWCCCTAGQETGPTTVTWCRCCPAARSSSPTCAGSALGQAPGRPGRAVQRAGAGAQRRGPDHLARHRAAGRRRLRHRQPDRAGPGPGPPDLVSALVISPPVPGVGTRVFGAGAAARVLVPGVPPAAAVGGAHRRQPGRGPRVPAALLGALVRAGVHGVRGAPRPPGLRLRAARRVHRLRPVVPGRARAPRRAAAETAPAPRTGSPRRPSCCGPSMTRCSPGSGRTGSTSSSAGRGSASWTASGHYAPLEYPSVIAEEVRGFLADEGPASDEGAW